MAKKKAKPVVTSAKNTEALKAAVKKDEAKKDKPAEAKKPKAAEAKEEKAATPKKAKAAEAKEEKAAEEKPTKAEKAAKPKAAGSPAIDEIIKAVETMTVLELSDLVKALEDKFGVSAAAPMAMMPGMMAGAGGPAEDAEEQTEFDVVLKEIGPQKIQVIKVVRAITGAGLIEAKKMVEEAPKAIKEAVNKDEAEKYKAQIEEVGATVEIK